MSDISERVFFVLLILNALAVLGYEIWNETDAKRKEDGRRTGGRIRAVIMLLAPVVGPLFFLMGETLYVFLFRTDVDLEDVIFSKERVRTNQRGDMEREGNMVPIEEALAVSDKDSLRTLIMNVIRGDVQNSLASIALALNSEDTETAHYAATVLRDALNDFREHSQSLYNQMKGEETDAKTVAMQLIEYMYPVLIQGVFHDSEQRGFVYMMEEAGTLLYEKFWRELTPEYIEWICTLLLRISDYKEMKTWCDHSRELYPEELSTYTGYLKLYFTMGKKKEFFEELNRLKASDVVIDKDTLELIRTFQ